MWGSGRKGKGTNVVCDSSNAHAELDVRRAGVGVEVARRVG